MHLDFEKLSYCVLMSTILKLSQLGRNFSPSLSYFAHRLTEPVKAFPELNLPPSLLPFRPPYLPSSSIKVKGLFGGGNYCALSKCVFEIAGF